MFEMLDPRLRNQRTYAAMLGALARGGKEKEALKLLKAAKGDGVVANSFMYNAAMSACTTTRQAFSLSIYYSRA